MTEKLKLGPKSLILEIASNDRAKELIKRSLPSIEIVKMVLGFESKIGIRQGLKKIISKQSN